MTKIKVIPSAMGDVSDRNNNYSMFQTSDEVDLKLEELESVFADEEGSKMERRRTAKEVISSKVDGIRQDSRRFYRFVKKHILNRNKDNTVKTINIVPEDDGTTWARRSASSAASRSSVDSASSSDSAYSGRENGLEIVHDMEDEFGIDTIPES